MNNVNYIQTRANIFIVWNPQWCKYCEQYTVLVFVFVATAVLESDEDVICDTDTYIL